MLNKTTTQLLLQPSPLTARKKCSKHSDSYLSNFEELLSQTFMT